MAMWKHFIVAFGGFYDWYHEYALATFSNLCPSQTTFQLATSQYMGIRYAGLLLEASRTEGDGTETFVCRQPQSRP